MMRPRDYLALAVEDIRAAKLRSFLTSLGIIIGVAAVTLLVAIGAGITSTVTGAFSELGSTRITVTASAPRGEDEQRAGPGGGGGFGGPVASTLSIDDAAALAALAEVEAVAPVIQVSGALAGPGGSLPLGLTGTTPSYLAATGQDLASGRMFNAPDEIVLNAVGAKRLFGSEPPLGNQIRLGQRQLTVVGLLTDLDLPFGQGGPGGGDEPPPAAYFPAEQALKMAETNRVPQIVLAAKSPELVDEVVNRSRDLLRQRHGVVEDFSVTSFQQLLRSFTQIFDVITIGLALIAGISLVVGGIGIMNIMLVSITQRTREIGIAKAIGATRSNVVVQFLLEAVVLSVFGGVVGLILARGGASVVRRAFDVPAAVTLGAAGLAVGVSAGIGLLFGVAPAWRAARLDPIEALRHE
jgi:putative ABC transport system permease protein